MKLIKIVVVALAFVLPCSHAFADEASQRQAVEELLLLSNQDKIMDGAWKQVQRVLDSEYKRMGSPKELQPIMTKYSEQMLAVMKKELSFASLKEQMITIYMQTYSEDEIKAILAFYKTPAGQKLIEKTPELMQKSMAMTQQRMPEIMRSLNQINGEMKKEIKAWQEAQQAKKE